MLYTNIVSYLYQRFFLGNNLQAVYLQKFIKNNDGDYRVTVIGGKFAYSFKRLNRPNDFRASGSGRIDYSSTPNEEIIAYCINFCILCCV
jgi:glutathione synthase/RimK-type ligase-like ATP-grasp enzyme